MEEINKIQCSKHGEMDIAVVCGHLVENNGISLGFIENSSEPTDLQGWCYACEHLFLEEDMSEKFQSFCSMAVVCTKCYKEIKNYHTFIWKEGKK